MSRYFSEKFKNLTPYVPGEQPRDQQYIKLNTNESPYPPSPRALELAAEAARNLQLYSDPECTRLRKQGADMLGIDPEEIVFTNGSDEALNFAFMAFCDEGCPAVFPDITYGFYKVFAQLNGVPFMQIPLKEDLTVCVEDYIGAGGTIFLANPNAPSGLALPLTDIEKIVAGNPDHVVVIDEAYVDFCGKSAIALTSRYDNLLVIQTFSKSRSMAGARLGFAVGSKELIRDLNTIRYSTNPYNVNAMTMAAGVGALEDVQYFLGNCEKICATRKWTTEQLRVLGFTAADSTTNFVLAKHPAIAGGELYRELRRRGVLVRHFDTDRLRDYNRITIGSREQMEIFIRVIKEILEEVL